MNSTTVETFYLEPARKEDNVREYVRSRGLKESSEFRYERGIVTVNGKSQCESIWKNSVRTM